MAKKTTWMVKVLTAEEPGRLVWKNFKEFTSPAEADDWLCGYVRRKGYSITDFNIIRRNG
ncbi:hypothetical protein [Robinsoniella peoriensis]|uniref:hypothetical protein n=1 Tax=Robinsoniella peoriensis TaxID=180332 RepID=UPI0037539246